MSILKFTKSKPKELADYLEEFASSPVSFNGIHLIEHSSVNHVHLWNLEYFSDFNKWINLEYKIEFVNYILEQWRVRLKGMRPYRECGYRMYVYTDLAPTISVVAETDVWFPYKYGKPEHVSSIKERS